MQRLCMAATHAPSWDKLQDIDGVKSMFGEAQSYEDGLQFICLVISAALQ